MEFLIILYHFLTSKTEMMYNIGANNFQDAIIVFPFLREYSELPIGFKYAFTLIYFQLTFFCNNITASV